jgi:predicted permease
MINWIDLKLRLRALLFRHRAENDLNEELAFHLAMTARKNQMAGMSERDANRNAQVQFGGVEQVKEECRDARGLIWLQTLWQDLRYAIRTFSHSKGFFLTVVATIALALGLNTALFSVFNAYMLRPLAVKDSFSLFRVSWSTRSGGFFLTPPEAKQVVTGKAKFYEALSYEPVFAKTKSQSLFGNRVSLNYFSLLGVDMAMGRPLREEDSLAAGIRGVVLSHGGWQAKFGADPEILGKKLPMFGGIYEVVGVARQGFNGVGQVPSDFWIPRLAVDDQGAIPGQTVVVRLKAGATRERVQAEMLAEARRITADRPVDQRVDSVDLQANGTVIPVDPESVAMFAPVAAAFVLVLLIACANVANMLLARSMSRQRELGVRLSLGAHRSRLIRQLVTESLVLAMPAAIMGFAIAELTIYVAKGALIASMPPIFSKMFRLADLAPDRPVYFFVLSASVLATLLFGLIPALQSTRTDLISAVRGEFSKNSRPSRLRSALVMCQVTVCVLLMISAGILLQASRKLAGRDPGMDIHHVSSIQFNQSVQARVLPFVSSQRWVGTVATAWHSPLAGALRMISAGPQNGALRVRAGYNFVSPEYFNLLRIRLTRGRNFTPDEASAESPVVIVSTATAHLLWPNLDALGQMLHVSQSEQRIDQGNKFPSFETAQVIGVASDVISGVVFDGRDPTSLYFPTSASGERNGALLVRFAVDSTTARQSLDELLDRVVPSAVLRVTPLDELFAAQVYPFQVSFAISSVLGGLALALTLSGIYGVLSYLVTQRTKEIGIRMALGANRSSVIRIVLSDLMRLTFVGTAFGVLLSLPFSKLLASELQNVSTFDGIAYLGGIAVVLIASTAAAFEPARRASQIAPAITLRCD